MLDGVLVELALFIGVALARAGVGRLRVPTFTLGALLLPLVDAFLCRGAAVRHGSTKENCSPLEKVQWFLTPSSMPS